MPERIAKVAQEYAQRQIKVGERFHVEPEHIVLLLALGRIEPEEIDSGYQTRDMTAGRPRKYRTKHTTQ
jgi:hypothetical protein